VIEITSSQGWRTQIQDAAGQCQQSHALVTTITDSEFAQEYLVVVL